MKASNLARYPGYLGGPLRPLDGLAYTFPALAALAGFWRPADLGLPLPRHKRITLKGNVRGFTPLFYADATKGIAPLTATPRAA